MKRAITPAPEQIYADMASLNTALSFPDEVKRIMDSMVAATSNGYLSNTAIADFKLTDDKP